MQIIAYHRISNSSLVNYRGTYHRTRATEIIHSGQAVLAYGGYTEDFRDTVFPSRNETKHTLVIHIEAILLDAVGRPDSQAGSRI